MLKTLALPLLLLGTTCANADETDFLKPRDNQTFDNYMMQAARYEASLFKHGKPSMFDAYFIGPTTPGEIRETYEHNELAAKKKYTNHSIRIKGEIESINEDAFGKGYIVAVDDASSMSSLEGVYLQIDKDDPVYLQLGKGDSIDAVCQIGSYLLGIPSLSKCFLTTTLFKEKAYENFTRSLFGGSLIKAKDISTENIARIKVSMLMNKFVLYASNYKNNESVNELACHNDEKKCTAAFLQDVKTGSPAFVESHRQDYKSLGSQVLTLLKE